MSLKTDEMSALFFGAKAMVLRRVEHDSGTCFIPSGQGIPEAKLAATFLLMAGNNFWKLSQMPFVSLSTLHSAWMNQLPFTSHLNATLPFVYNKNYFQVFLTN